MRRITGFGLVAVMTLVACVGTTGAGARGDGSTDAAERTKSAFGVAASGDTSYDVVEQARARLVLDSSAADHPQGSPTGIRAVPQ